MSFIIRFSHQCSLNLFIVGSLLGLLFHPEDGIDTFLRNVGELLLNSSSNNGIYLSGVYKSFQLHARTFTLHLRNLSLSVCSMHLLLLTFKAASLCHPSVSECLYIGSKLVSLYNVSPPTFCYTLLASRS
jgi:hypothetical protein